ncbi:Hypothetical protein POVR2_LOCUS194, partial [uncultured virus]
VLANDKFDVQASSDWEDMYYQIDSLPSGILKITSGNLLDASSRLGLFKLVKLLLSTSSTCFSQHILSTVRTAQLYQHRTVVRLLESDPRVAIMLEANERAERESMALRANGIKSITGNSTMSARQLY